MADQHLRHLARVAGGGDLLARGRLLRERVRAGALAEDRLRLAAHLGDPASRAALGLPPRIGPAELAPGVLTSFGAPGAVCAALAAGEAARPLLTSAIAPELRTASMYTWNRAVSCRCALQVAWKFIEGAEGQWRHGLERAVAATTAATRQCESYLALTGDPERGQAERAGRLIVRATAAAAALAGERPADAVAEAHAALALAADLLEPARLEEGLREVVVPWALGQRG